MSPTIHDVLRHHDPARFAAALELHLAAREAARPPALGEEEQVALAVLAFEREVVGGGFEQYFASEASDTALETVDALEAIGATRSAALLRQACGIFPRRTPPADVEEREEHLANLSEDAASLLGRLDSLFYDADESLGALLRAYVEESTDAFRDVA